jgi:hypothetical protein
MAFSTDQITITGTGSLSIPSMPTASSLTNIVVFNSSSGQFTYTSSAAIGGGNSGTWTPTFSAFFGTITAATLNSATYQRVGNIVTGYINVDITFNFSGAPDGSFEFTYPFATASNLGGGSVNSIFIAKQFNGAVKNNVIHILSEDTTLAGTATFYAIFQYEIN